MSSIQATQGTQDNTGGTLFVALELSAKSWKLAFRDASQRRPRLVSVRAGDLQRLDLEISKAKKRFHLPEETPVLSCYEAGRDGFWIHGALVARGIRNLVVDSASIEQNRRFRRVKTDRVDATKLVNQLVRHSSGEKGVWSVLRVPSVEEEDARQLHREREQLKKERMQHRCRIQSLLLTQGIQLKAGKSFSKELERIRLWDGRALPADLRSRLDREFERLKLVESQLWDLEQIRKRRLKESKSESIEKVRRLMQVRGIGVNSAWVNVMEFYGWREFQNRRQVAGASGLTPAPWRSGQGGHDQGISKAGNPRVRWLAVEMAWGWLRFQPQSKLSRWYAERFAHGNGRLRRIGIVAVARRLLIDLWRFLEHGIVPEGAVLRAG